MGFEQGLSGLNAASENLDVIGNNVANAGTVGFKQSVAQFADMYASTLAGSGAAPGIGVRVADVAQQFAQGNITTTNNSLDMAINGNGFFRMDNNGSISYSRNGQFQMNNLGYIVDNQGNKLTGFLPNALGAIVSTTPVDIQIPTTGLQPTATTSVLAGVNLNSTSTVPTTVPFNPTDSTSYTSSTSTTIYDSLGGSHTASLYFVKTAANAWQTYLTVDGLPAAGTALTPLAFNTSGALTTAMPVSTTFTPAGGGAAQTVKFDFTGTTQFGASFGVNSLSQNGYTSGQLTGFTTGSDGLVTGNYSNGQTKTLAQVALTNFSNEQGLQPLGNNQWAQTAASGTPLVGAPGTSSLGVLQTSATEDSNVDLTTQLVDMITAQRNYQANAQTIKTEDQIMQTIVSLQ